MAPSAQAHSGSHVLITSVLSPMPPPRSLVSAWRLRTTAVRDTLHLLCPQDGFMMNRHCLLPSHGLLREADACLEMFCLCATDIPAWWLLGHLAKAVTACASPVAV